jgi:hypothetical protein
MIFHFKLWRLPFMPALATPAATTPAAVPTAAEVQKLAAQWYRNLDVHAPVEQLLPLLADGDLEMQFPEATLRGTLEFESWYDRVINIFFDEVHTLKNVEIDSAKEGVLVKVVVRWEASTWNPPEPKSRRIKLDAYQTWRVTRSPSTGKPVISRYTVDELVYDKDSARL